jgi:hypothetical protein
MGVRWLLVGQGLLKLLMHLFADPNLTHDLLREFGSAFRSLQFLGTAPRLFAFVNKVTKFGSGEMDQKAGQDDRQNGGFLLPRVD